MTSESQRDVSFDPRSWVGPEAGGIGAPSPPPPAPAPAPDGEKARWTIAAVASIAVLLVGLVCAVHQRGATPPPAPASTSAAAG